MINDASVDWYKSKFDCNINRIQQGQSFTEYYNSVIYFYIILGLITTDYQFFVEINLHDLFWINNENYWPCIFSFERPQLNIVAPSVDPMYQLYTMVYPTEIIVIPFHLDSFFKSLPALGGGTCHIMMI